MADPYAWRRVAHIPLIIILQFLFVILFAKFVVYDEHSAIKNVGFDAGGPHPVFEDEAPHPEPSGENEDEQNKAKAKAKSLHETTRDAKEILTDYPMFQDVHVMIFIGFGFLMTFLKYHGWSSVMFNMLVSCWCIQWGILNISFFHALFEGHWSKVKLDITYLVEGDFAAGATLISFGAVLGKVNSFQLLVMATIEVVIYSCNVGLGQKQFHAVDMGGSMFVHTFGAYFGVACALALGPKNMSAKNTKIGSDYTSNLFAAIGCIFLFMFWPSFNGVLATGNGQHRVVVNTVLAISASTLGAFYVSNIVNKGLFGMEDCLNASLAGGVIIGSSSDLVADAWLSILIGFFGGVISCLCYNKLQPCLEKCIGLHDTCGVHNLHGIPGILGGIIGAISSGVANTEVYGDQLNTIFTELANGRTQAQQAGYQLATLASTLGMSLVGGYLTG